MSFYQDAHYSDRTGGLKELFEDKRKQDKILDSIISGNGSYSKCIMNIEKKLKTKRNYSKNQIELDNEYNALVDYTTDILGVDISVKNKLLTGSEMNQNYKTQRKLSLGVSALGYGTAAFIGIATIAIPPFAILAAGALSAAGTCAHLDLSPRAEIKRERKKAMKGMKFRAEELDKLISETYLITEEPEETLKKKTKRNLADTL